MEKTLYNLRVHTMITRQKKTFTVTLLAENENEIRKKIHEWFKAVKKSYKDYIINWTYCK